VQTLAEITTLSRKNTTTLISVTLPSGNYTGLLHEVMPTNYVLVCEVYTV